MSKETVQKSNSNFFLGKNERLKSKQSGSARLKPNKAIKICIKKESQVKNNKTGVNIKCKVLAPSASCKSILPLNSCILSKILPYNYVFTQHRSKQTKPLSARITGTRNI